METKFLKIYQNKNKSLSIHVGIDLRHWGIPFGVSSIPVVSAFGIHLLQLRFLCFFVEVESLDLDEKTNQVKGVVVDYTAKNIADFFRKKIIRKKR